MRSDLTVGCVRGVVAGQEGNKNEFIEKCIRAAKIGRKRGAVVRQGVAPEGFHCTFFRTIMIIVIVANSGQATNRTLLRSALSRGKFAIQKYRDYY